TGISGTVSADFGFDGPGHFATTNSFTSSGSKLGGNLTSDGVAVVVSQTGNTYTGKAGGTTVFTLVLDPATGHYDFTQFKALDHANASDPTDIIKLTFGFNAIDSDGDTGAGTITIDVKDDAPTAANDSATVAPGTMSVSGNVVTNDHVGNDQPGYT